jgi:hypothetical protein
MKMLNQLTLAIVLSFLNLSACSESNKNDFPMASMPVEETVNDQDQVDSGSDHSQLLETINNLEIGLKMVGVTFDVSWEYEKTMKMLRVDLLAQNPRKLTPPVTYSELVEKLVAYKKAASLYVDPLTEGQEGIATYKLKRDCVNQYIEKTKENYFEEFKNTYFSNNYLYWLWVENGKSNFYYTGEIWDLEKIKNIPLDFNFIELETSILRFETVLKERMIELGIDFSPNYLESYIKIKNSLESIEIPASASLSEIKDILINQNIAKLKKDYYSLLNAHNYFGAIILNPKNEIDEAHFEKTVLNELNNDRSSYNAEIILQRFLTTSGAIFYRIVKNANELIEPNADLVAHATHQKTVLLKLDNFLQETIEQKRKRRFSRMGFRPL